MAERHRRHSTAREREIVEAYFNGDSIRALSQNSMCAATLIELCLKVGDRG